MQRNREFSNLLQGRIFDYQGNCAPVHAMIWFADIRLKRAKRMIEQAGTEAKFGFKAHPHMLRHACR